MDDTPRYWYGLKRHPFGPRLPLTWEGWLVDAVWLAIWLALTPFIRSRDHGLQGLGVFFGMLVLLFAIGHWKGEPKRWDY